MVELEKVLVLRELEKEEKVYFKPGENPPKEAAVQRGPKGGIFYEAPVAKEAPTKVPWKPIIQGSLKDAYSKFLGSGRVNANYYNQLLAVGKGKGPAKLRQTIAELAQEMDNTRKAALGDRAAAGGYQIADSWIEGILFKVVGLRMVAAEMKGQELSESMVKAMMESIVGKPVDDKAVQSAMSLGLASWQGIEGKPGSKDMKMTTEPIKSILKAEATFAAKRTRELFGDEITVYRGVYGETAKKIEAELKAKGIMELEDFPLSSYSQDYVAAFAFVNPKPNALIIKRKIKAEDVQFAWYSNPAFINYMPEQREVVVHPASNKFTITKGDVTWL